METDERPNFLGPAGVMAMACRQRRPDATREAPAVIINKDPLATRERQAGPCGVAERFVVARKPSNVVLLRSTHPASSRSISQTPPLPSVLPITGISPALMRRRSCLVPIERYLLASFS